MTKLEEMLSKVKVIASEIDGILTEDLVHTDELGNVPFKKYCVKDFEAINELKKTFTFVFVASDPRVNFNLCRSKNIPFYFDKKNKNDALRKAMKKYGVGAEEVLYIGRSFSDLENIRMIPFSLCPDDAIDEVKAVACHSLGSFGGYGVLCEVYDILKPEISRRKTLTK